MVINYAWKFHRTKYKVELQPQTVIMMPSCWRAWSWQEALQVVKLTACSAYSDDQAVCMMTSPFQWLPSLTFNRQLWNCAGSYLIMIFLVNLAWGMHVDYDMMKTVTRSCEAHDDKFHEISSTNSLLVYCMTKPPDWCIFPFLHGLLVMP